MISFLNDLRKLNEVIYPRMTDRFCALGIEPDKEPFQIVHPSLQIDLENISKLLNHYGLKKENKILALCPGAEFDLQRDGQQILFQGCTTLFR